MLVEDEVQRRALHHVNDKSWWLVINRVVQNIDTSIIPSSALVYDQPPPEGSDNARSSAILAK